MSELKSLFRLTCSDMAVLRYIPILFHSMVAAIQIHQNLWETVTTFQNLIKSFTSSSRNNSVEQPSTLAVFTLHCVIYLNWNGLFKLSSQELC